VNAYTLVASITSSAHALGLLAFRAILTESVITIALTASVVVEVGSTPAVYAIIDLGASACAASWVAFVAHFTVGTPTGAGFVALLTLSFKVQVLIPVTVVEVTGWEV